MLIWDALILQHLASFEPGSSEPRGHSEKEEYMVVTQ